MSDHRTGNGALSNVNTTSNDGHHDKEGSSQRAVRSTRTPATRSTALTRDVDHKPHSEQPHRSQTVPTPAPSASAERTHRTPHSQSTVPVPNKSTRQRTPSNPQSQPTASHSNPPHPPELSRPPIESKNSLGGTDYIVERLPSIALRERAKEQESRDNPYLTPRPQPAPSMPVPSSSMLTADARHSGSSYEPSSYYSAEDKLSSVGAPSMPQMPEHKDEEDTLESRYRELWLAAQGGNEPPPPPMPIPELAHPHLPSPYDAHIEEDEEEEEDDEEGESQSADAEDHLDDIGEEEEEEPPAPSMPVPSVPSPLIPTPSITRPEHRRMGSQGSAFIEHTQPSDEPLKTGNLFGDIPPTAPLRPQRHVHQPRPTGVGATSPHNLDFSNTGPPSPSLPLPQTEPTSQNVNASHLPYSTAPAFPKPQSTRPAASPVPGPASGRPSAQRHGYQSRPPGAAAPSIPPDIDVNKIRTQSQKPVSVYAQDSQSNVPLKTQGQQPTSILQTGRRSENDHPPAVPTHTAAPATAHQTSSSPPPSTPPKPGAIAPHAPSTSSPLKQSVSDDQPSKPTSSAPPKVNTVVTHAQPTSSTSRPQIQHVSEKPQPQPSRPTTSAPPVQPSPSTSKTDEPDKEKKRMASDSGAMPSRPQGSTPVHHTQYVNMLLALDDIPALYNILAGFFTWILLAGFILFPGTFASLQNSNATTLPTQVEQRLLNTVTRLPLFIVAWICTGVGVAGMIWLWWRWRKNYIWGLNKIFLPGFLNSLAGLLSTLASLFGAQHGQLSTTSKSTLIVTSAATGVLGILSGFYMFWLIRRVKARHDREVGKERAGKYGEGVVDLSKKR